MRGHDRPEHAHEPHRLVAPQGLDAREEGPRLVVDDAEVLGGLLQVLHVDVLDMVARRGVEVGRTVEDAVAVLRDSASPNIGMLVEVVAEAVTLEQILVVGRVVGILVERLELVALHEQPPPRVAVAEVDGAVHRLHAAAGEPHARRVEHHVGGLLVVDALEKSAAARGLGLQHRLLAVVEGGDAAHDLSRGVAQHPAYGLAAREKVVLRGIEHRADRGVERTHPVAVAAVDSFGQVEPLAFESGVGHLLQGIFGLFAHG